MGDLVFKTEHDISYKYSFQVLFFQVKKKKKKIAETVVFFLIFIEVTWLLSDLFFLICSGSGNSFCEDSSQEQLQKTSAKDCIIFSICAYDGVIPTHCSFCIIKL
jgi:hypothetical protein